MDFRIDRELPISLRLQLKGLIEYGIACGELKAGDLVPSVREMAERVGVAPMTVSQVYRELKDAGLIEARTGSGTFVADSSHARMASRPDAVKLRRQIDALIDEGLASGIRATDLAALVHARLFHRASLGRRVAVVMVGVFPEATATYARGIAARLGDAATVAPTTLSALERSAEARARAASADVVVTLINRQREAAALLPNSRVVAISFIPSEETRRALASLDPMLRVGVVSRFPDFLPIMKAGVERFAPHVAVVAGVTLDTEGVDAVVARSDVIVYATGAERIIERLPAGARALEYRHIPDPVDIERVVLPAVRAARPLPLDHTLDHTLDHKEAS